MGQQRSNHVLSFGCLHRPEQRGKPVDVLGINIGLVGQQQVNHVLLTRLDQRSLAIVVRRVDISVVEQQQRRHFLVATGRRPEAKAWSRLWSWH